MLRIVPAQPDRQADSLEAGIVGPLRHPVIGQGGNDLFRDCISAGKIVHGDGAVVDGHTEQQNIEIHRFSILIGTGFPDVDT